MANLKSISPADHVKAYPDEHLTVRKRKLFCSACREEVAIKKSCIELHLKSQKHVKGKKRLVQNSQHEGKIIEVLKKYDHEVNLDGETLPDSTQVYRVKVITSMLKAGVTLSKIDSFQDLLEEKIIDMLFQILIQLLPFIVHEEISQ